MKESVTFYDFANYWLYSKLKNQLKPTSFTRKEVTLNNQVFPIIGNIPIKDITHADIQSMVNELNDKGLSYSTVKKAYEAVNGCIRDYRIQTGGGFNPCEGIALPSAKQRDISDVKFFNEEQRIAIKREATRKYKSGTPVYRLGHCIVLLMYTGLRVGELLGLTWDDIDFDNRTISVNKNAVVTKVSDGDEVHYKMITQNSTKTNSGNRIIPMTQEAYNSLMEIYKINSSHKFVMSSSSGTQITPRNINRLFHSILLKSGVVSSDKDLCGVHTLRHTFASMLFQNGCDVKVVSEILGHSDTKITENIYIHVIQGQKVKAIQDIDKYSC